MDRLKVLFVTFLICSIVGPMIFLGCELTYHATNSEITLAVGTGILIVCSIMAAIIFVFIFVCFFRP